MTDLHALAGRVEGAAGPDRELDYLIHEAIHGEWLRKHGYQRLSGDEGWQTVTPPIPGATEIAPPQDYSCSLDAAMLLVPEGCWAEGSLGRGDISRSSIEIHRPDAYDALGESIAATPALALTSACLRAIASDRT